ncbi:hypothetical protein BGX38DRAFT_1156084 [Terfezia claveryi]|nr:hypothetical protein BGX38DRAFT_1156084 [Terfezia claveryi]
MALLALVSAAQPILNLCALTEKDWDSRRHNADGALSVPGGTICWLLISCAVGSWPVAQPWQVIRGRSSPVLMLYGYLVPIESGLYVGCGHCVTAWAPHT